MRTFIFLIGLLSNVANADLFHDCLEVALKHKAAKKELICNISTMEENDGKAVLMAYIAKMDADKNVAMKISFLRVEADKEICISLEKNIFNCTKGEK